MRLRKSPIVHTPVNFLARYAAKPCSKLYRYKGITLDHERSRDLCIEVSHRISFHRSGFERRRKETPKNKTPFHGNRIRAMSLFNSRLFKIPLISAKKRGVIVDCSGLLCCPIGRLKSQVRSISGVLSVKACPLRKARTASVFLWGTQSLILLPLGTAGRDLLLEERADHSQFIV